jgi:inhibitor of KinA
MSLSPVVRSVGDSALLIDFGDTIDEATNARVVALDRALAANPPQGLGETVPAYCALLLEFDPLVISAPDLAGYALGLTDDAAASAPAGREHIVPVCYDASHAPDLAEVAARAGLTQDAVIAAHLAARYRVFLYGFAPGYAYLGGVPPALQLPRKPAAERGHPAGSVIIAGPQCLITTLAMPTGWWVIGQTSLAVLDPMGARPFRFDPGDTIRFERVATLAPDART